MIIVKTPDACLNCLAAKCNTTFIDDCEEADLAAEQHLQMCEACKMNSDTVLPHYDGWLPVRCKCLTIPFGAECPHYIPDTDGALDE